MMGLGGLPSGRRASVVDGVHWNSLLHSRPESHQDDGGSLQIKFQNESEQQRGRCRDSKFRALQVGSLFEEPANPPNRISHTGQAPTAK
jgi:hypothetical protein